MTTTNVLTLESADSWQYRFKMVSRPSSRHFTWKGRKLLDVLLDKQLLYPQMKKLQGFNVAERAIVDYIFVDFHWYMIFTRIYNLFD